MAMHNIMRVRTGRHRRRHQKKTRKLWRQKTRRMRRKGRQTRRKRWFGGIGDETTCSICLEPFTAENPQIRLHCDHVFHKQCMLEHVHNSRHGNRVCPLDRQTLTMSDFNLINDGNADSASSSSYFTPNVDSSPQSEINGAIDDEYYDDSVSPQDQYEAW